MDGAGQELLVHCALHTTCVPSWSKCKIVSHCGFLLLSLLLHYTYTTLSQTFAGHSSTYFVCCGAATGVPLLPRQVHSAEFRLTPSRSDAASTQTTASPHHTTPPPELQPHHPLLQQPSEYYTPPIAPTKALPNISAAVRCLPTSNWTPSSTAQTGRPQHPCA
jgi:hypothetical protein